MLSARPERLDGDVCPFQRRVLPGWGSEDTRVADLLPRRVVGSRLPGEWPLLRREFWRELLPGVEPDMLPRLMLPAGLLVLPGRFPCPVLSHRTG